MADSLDRFAASETGFEQVQPEASRVFAELIRAYEGQGDDEANWQGDDRMEGLLGLFAGEQEDWEEMEPEAVLESIGVALRRIDQFVGNLEARLGQRGASLNNPRANRRIRMFVEMATHLARQLAEQGAGQFYAKATGEDGFSEESIGQAQERVQSKLAGDPGTLAGQAIEQAFGALRVRLEAERGGEEAAAAALETAALKEGTIHEVVAGDAGQDRSTDSLVEALLEEPESSGADRVELPNVSDGNWMSLQMALEQASMSDLGEQIDADALAGALRRAEAYLDRGLIERLRGFSGADIQAIEVKPLAEGSAQVRIVLRGQRREEVLAIFRIVDGEVQDLTSAMQDQVTESQVAEERLIRAAQKGGVFSRMRKGLWRFAVMPGILMGSALALDSGAGNVDDEARAALANRPATTLDISDDESGDEQVGQSDEAEQTERSTAGWIDYLTNAASAKLDRDVGIGDVSAYYVNGVLEQSIGDGSSLTMHFDETQTGTTVVSIHEGDKVLGSLEVSGSSSGAQQLAVETGRVFDRVQGEQQLVRVMEQQGRSDRGLIAIHGMIDEVGQLLGNDLDLTDLAIIKDGELPAGSSKSRFELRLSSSDDGAWHAALWDVSNDVILGSVDSTSEDVQTSSVMSAEQLETIQRQNRALRSGMDLLLKRIETKPQLNKMEVFTGEGVPQPDNEKVLIYLVPSDQAGWSRLGAVMPDGTRIELPVNAGGELPQALARLLGN